MKRDTARGAIWIVILIVLQGGCALQDHHIGDVDEIRRSGELRVVVRPGFFGSVRTRELSERESELLNGFAARLGVGIRWIEARRGDRVLPMVRGGRADLAVGRFPVVGLGSHDLRATAALEWVDDLLIASPPEVAADRGGKRRVAHFHRSALTPALSSYLTERGLAFEEVPEEISVETILERVRTGRYPHAIVDSQIAHSFRAANRVQVLDRIPVRRPIVWAVRNDAVRLRRAADDFLFAERVLGRGKREWACRDLRQIRRQGVLRLVTRNSATTCTVEHGGLSGFEYELALNFARHLRVNLELSIPPSDVDPLQWLAEGYGDLAALHEPVAPADRGAFLVSEPYRTVDLVSVVSSRAALPESVEELAGVRASASKPAASLARLLPLPAPIRARPSHVGADAFSAMQQVARGRAPVALVDRDAARLTVAGREDLLIGAVVVPKAELVWVFNVSSPRLLRAANRWLRESRKSGFVRQLGINQFGKPKRLRSSSMLPIPENALSPYDELLQWVGRTYDIDWRLLASLMYEESRFDPAAVGPGGSAGLFQFMPFTWRELGVEDPHHPQEAAEAAGRYLRQLMDEFSGLPLPDQVAMAIASYNVGPRHLFDARRLATEMGLDPDRWIGSVETAMLILDDPEVARSYAAGVCRCRRAVAYTRRILRRYGAYTEQFPPA